MELKPSSALPLPLPFLLLLLLLVSSSLSSSDHRGGREGGHPTTTPCATTLNAQELKRSYRLDSVKDDILRKLRMDSPPNVTGPDPSTPAVQTLLRQMASDRGSPGLASPAEADLQDHDHVSQDTFILLSQRIPPEKRIELQNTCYFRFSPDLKASQVVTAKLGIYVRSWDPSPVNGQSAATLIVLFVLSRSSSDPTRLERTAFRRKRLLFSQAIVGKWYHFDVKSLAENWMRSESSNLGIQVYAQDPNGDPLAILPTSNESTNALRPYIEIQMAETRTQQTGSAAGAGAMARRSAATAADGGSHCDETGSQRRCCRYPLRIDFDAFGWDWVIAPKQYDAYYCSGDCPFLYYHQQNPHTHIYTQTNVTGVPCCSPSFMSPLQLLYVDSRNSLILGTLPSMIVERCGCS